MQKADSFEKSQVRQEEKGTTEDEMVGWHHWLDRHEWVNFESWWWTGKLGVLQSMGSQRVRHERVTELNWTDNLFLLNGLLRPFHSFPSFFPLLRWFQLFLYFVSCSILLKLIDTLFPIFFSFWMCCICMSLHWLIFSSAESNMKLIHSVSHLRHFFFYKFNLCLL